MNEKKGFEETYVAYPFPMLVEFGLALSGLFVRVRDRRAETPKSAPKNTPGGATFAR